MRPRTELGLGAGLVLALAVAAGVAGLGRARLTEADQRRSTFLAGPAGAQGYAEALARLGVRVERSRRPLGSLDGVSGRRTVVAFLGPSIGLDPHDGSAVASLPGNLLLAGPGAAAAIRCLGWDVRPRFRDSLAVVPPGTGWEPFPRVRAVLARRDSSVVVETPDGADSAPLRCTAPDARTVDTLLRTTAGRPVAVRATLDDGRTVTLVADDRLFANQALRRTGAGPFALGLVARRYDRIVVDEYHHGFDASRSLAAAALEWTLHSPLGWAVLQLAGVGVIALLAAGVRFGPVRAGVERRRRSSLEHVRALATALAAARGHDVAVGLLVQGLRRRLSRAGLASRGDAGPWLDGLAPAIRTERGREALETLVTITRNPASGADVLHAAEAVETLWEELTPT